MKHLDPMDALLLLWADWAVSLGIAEGFNLSLGERNHGGDRPIGTHSDPVFSEVSNQQNSQGSRIHRLLLQYPTRHRTVVRLRYVGVPIALVEPVNGYDTAVDTPGNLTLRRSYTGLMPYRDVAEATHQLWWHDTTVDQVRTIITNVKKALKRDLSADQRVRRGLTGTDGNLHGL